MAFILLKWVKSVTLFSVDGSCKVPKLLNIQINCIVELIISQEKVSTTISVAYSQNKYGCYSKKLQAVNMSILSLFHSVFIYISYPVQRVPLLLETFCQ